MCNKALNFIVNKNKITYLDDVAVVKIVCVEFYEWLADFSKNLFKPFYQLYSFSKNSYIFFNIGIFILKFILVLY